MTTAELKEARQELFDAFFRLLEASWADPGSVRDAEILEAADMLDDATDHLVDVLRDVRRQGVVGDRQTPPFP